MSTPSNGDQPWQQPGQQPPGSGSGSGSGSGYGQPSSPSYGKYGQGQALPPAPPEQTQPDQSPPPPPPYGQNPYGQPPYGQNSQGQNPYGQNPYGQNPYGQNPYSQPPPYGYAQPTGPTVLQPSSTGLVTAVSALTVLTSITICLLPILAPNQNQALRDAFHAAENATSTSRPATFTPAQGSVLDQLLQPVGLLLDLAVWVVFSLWLARVRQNALVLAPNGQRRSEIWVWLCWLPIVDLWFPKQILDDTIAATAWAANVPRLKTGLWWTLYICLGVVGSIQFICIFFPPNSALHLALSVIEVLLAASALVLLLRMVRWITTTQDTLVARQRGVTLPR